MSSSITFEGRRMRLNFDLLVISTMLTIAMAPKAVDFL